MLIIDQIKMIVPQLCTTIISKIINNYLISGIFMKRKKNGSFGLGNGFLGVKIKINFKLFRRNDREPRNRTENENINVKENKKY